MVLEDILMPMDKYMKDFIKGRPRGNANIISGGKTIPVEYSDGRFYQI